MSLDLEDCCEVPIINKVIITTNDYTEYFTLIIKVHLSNYSDGKYLYWYVHCLEEYNYCCHPLRNVFRNDTNISKQVSGVVTNNSFIRQLLTYLCLEDDQLNVFSGNINVVEYRSNLIKTLLNFAD